MGIIVRWSETATFAAELSVSDAELAEWAVANLPLRTLQQTSRASVAPEPAQLVRSLQSNPHLRAAIVRVYAEAAATLRTEHRILGLLETHDQANPPTDTDTATSTDTVRS